MAGSLAKQGQLGRSSTGNSESSSICGAVQCCAVRVVDANALMQSVAIDAIPQKLAHQRVRSATSSMRRAWRRSADRCALRRDDAEMERDCR